jgi:ribosome recycling factor
LTRELDEQTELVKTLEKECESLRGKVRRYRQQIATSTTDADSSTVGADGDDIDAE